MQPAKPPVVVKGPRALLPPPARGKSPSVPSIPPSPLLLDCCATRVQRLLLGGAVFITGLLCYRVVQALVEPAASCETAWDRAIPFVPGMIWPYAALLPYILLAGWRATPRTFPVLVFAGLASLFIASLCFTIVPLTMTRPDVTAMPPGITRSAFAWLHGHDAVHNTFPSLHVAIAWVCALGAHAHRKWWMIGAVIISLSTLLVKQHTLLDVASGIALAWAAVHVIDRAISRVAGPETIRALDS